MNATDLHILRGDTHKLLASGNADAALLYLYLQSGNPIEDAAGKLRFNQGRIDCAAALLRQLCLWQPEKIFSFSGERPNYTESDVIRAMDGDLDFKGLYSEVQRLLGKNLNTEELKILLGFVRYLGLPGDVICVLICYCKDRARRKGSLRNPSLRTIEKEAYYWAEQGIDTMEEAAAFMQKKNLQNSQLGQLMAILQIRGRTLTPGEEKYALSWLEMGFSQDALALAYERTCINTGNLSWAYMNRILTRWHEAGLHTAQDVQNKDKKPAAPKGATGQLGQAELDAIAMALQEG